MRRVKAAKPEDHIRRRRTRLQELQHVKQVYTEKKKRTVRPTKASLVSLNATKRGGGGGESWWALRDPLRGRAGRLKTVPQDPSVCRDAAHGGYG